jgi:hypothetical protein
MVIPAIWPESKALPLKKQGKALQEAREGLGLS